MEFQDIIYLALLIFSILFGYFMKQIEDLQQRKRINTIVGIVIIFIVSGSHILHNLIFFVVNAIIILYCSKRQCHIISFAFSFAYLLFFRTTEYFGIPYPPSHTNMVQMMLTLRMTSVAFDINKLYNDKKKKEAGDYSDEERAMLEYDDFSIDCVELFHYNFNYIGVLVGPFIRYRTFRDYYTKPFAKYAPSKDVIMKKLQLLPIFVIGYLGMSYFVSFSYIKSEEFFTERSVLYRLLYCIPLFFVFRMRLFIAFLLCECICIVAGFGAYPAITEPTSGGGPTKNFQLLQKLSKNENELKNIEINFHTIDAVDVWGTEFAPTFKEGMRAWNTAVQYWLATCVYKRFPYKQYRAVVTLVVSSAWHGIYIGHYICLGCAALVLPIDDVCSKLLLKGKTGMVLYINEWIMLFISRFYFAYLSMAFYYLSVGWVLTYYNSVYHLGIIIGLVIYFGGQQILKLKIPTSEPKRNK